MAPASPAGGMVLQIRCCRVRGQARYAGTLQPAQKTRKLDVGVEGANPVDWIRRSRPNSSLRNRVELPAISISRLYHRMIFLFPVTCVGYQRYRVRKLNRRNNAASRAAGGL